MPRCRSESLRVGCTTFNPLVDGSTPSRPTIYCLKISTYAAEGHYSSLRLQFRAGSVIPRRSTPHTLP